LDAPPAPEQGGKLFAEIEKPRRNSWKDSVAGKFADWNRASAPFLQSMESNLNRGINKLNGLVGSLTENNAQQRFQNFWPQLTRTETLLAEFDCETIAPTGKTYPGHLMMTTGSVLFQSREAAPNVYRFRMELVNILSISRTLINGCDSIQIFDLNHNMVQLQHFANLGTFLAEGVCNTIPSSLLNNSLSQPLNNTLFGRVFKQIEAAWQSRAELPPPEFHYAETQMPIVAGCA
jgi:hypothetical protein